MHLSYTYVEVLNYLSSFYSLCHQYLATQVVTEKQCFNNGNPTHKTKHKVLIIKHIVALIYSKIRHIVVCKIQIYGQKKYRCNHAMLITIIYLATQIHFMCGVGTHHKMLIAR